MGVGAALLASTSITALSAVATPPDSPFDASVLEPVDPQNWTTSEEMTWDDYVPVPGKDWANFHDGTQRKLKAAVVLLDFEGKDFLITKPAGTNALTNPSNLVHDVPRAELATYYQNFLNTPQALNHGRTINDYWAEQSSGRITWELEGFGPYRLPGRPEQYGLDSNMNSYSATAKPDPFGNYTDPDGHTGTGWFCPWGPDPVTPQACNKTLRTDGIAQFRLDLISQGRLPSTATANSPLSLFDQVFYVTAGQDESSTWEEWGQMIFADATAVTDDFGPPRTPGYKVDADGDPVNIYGKKMSNWAKTRYIEWSSWAAAVNHWPNASSGSGGNGGSSTQAESSGLGTFVHEASHVLGIGDNYGNPFETIEALGGPLRDTSGPWDVLSRGQINGPGGTHQRFQVPAVTGGSQAAGIPLRDRIKFGIIDQTNYLNIAEADLDAAGAIGVEVTARTLLRENSTNGINLVFDRPTGEQWADNSSGACRRGTSTSTSNGGYNYGALNPPYLWDCDGGRFDNYTVEVIDHMGTDSFVPDTGVNISKTKNADNNPYIWNIDANPTPIGLVDYVRPNGDVIMVTRGDQRQLNDALFHAGTESGSDDEYVDQANGLHFYIANRHHDDLGLLQYDIAIRSTASPGPQVRGVSLGAPVLTGTNDNEIVQILVPVTNTGGQVADPKANLDIYRVAASVSGTGWAVTIPEAIQIIETGATQQVPVYVSKTSPDATVNGIRVTLSVTSENSPAATASTQTSLTTGAGWVEALRSAVAVYALHEAQQASYTPDSYAPLAAALADARVIIGWGSAPEATVRDAIAALATAAANLVQAVDHSVLDALIAAAAEVIAFPDLHVAAFLPDLVAAKAAAEALLATPGYTQDQVLSQAISLASVLSKVVAKGDKGPLAQLLAAIAALDSSRYTPATWGPLAASVTAAQAVIANPDATEFDVADALADLGAKASALVLQAAKSGLSTVIAVAQAISANTAAYYPASVAGLPAALSTARAVLADQNATTAQVTAAQTALITVVAGAKLKPVSPGSAAIALTSSGAVAAAALDPAAAAAPAAAPKAFKAAKPVIKGKAKVGQKLKAKAGAWSPKPALSYQWYRGGKAIAKATAATYKVKAADKGKRLTVKVTASKAGYATAVKASAKTKTVK
jgi:hypothetical protein